MYQQQPQSYPSYVDPLTHPSYEWYLSSTATHTNPHSQVSHFAQESGNTSRSQTRFNGHKIEKKRIMTDMIQQQQQYKYGLPVHSLPSPNTTQKKSRDVVPLDRKRASSLSTHMMIEILQRKSATPAISSTNSSPSSSHSSSPNTSARASPICTASTTTTEVPMPCNNLPASCSTKQLHKLKLDYILN